MTRTLVVFAHPVAESYGAHLRDRAVAGLQVGGHEVEVLDLHDEGFDPKLTEDEWARHLDPPETKLGVTRHVDLVRWAEHLVFVYPTWYGTQPAMLSGWLQRVFINGLAFDLPEGASRIRGRLRHVRRISVVTTHGSKRWANWLTGQSGRKIMAIGIRSLCHPLTRVRWHALYGLDFIDEPARTAFGDKVEAHFAR